MKLSDEQKHIIRCEENEFPKLFASYQETEYGIFFYNEKNKDSHDSNHAVIYPERIENLAAVLEDITAFYKSKSVIPTVFHPFIKDYFVDNEEVFNKKGFKINCKTDNRIYILSEESCIEPNNELDVRWLKSWDKRIATDILIPNGEYYEVPVAEATMKNNNSYLMVGYKNGKAVVYLQFHVSPRGCTRFDYIDTAKDERGKGYARKLAHETMSFCLKEKLPLCTTWFANSTSEKLNFEAGFRPTNLWLENGYVVLEELS